MAKSFLYEINKNSMHWKKSIIKLVQRFLFYLTNILSVIKNKIIIQTYR